MKIHYQNLEKQILIVNFHYQKYLIVKIHYQKLETQILIVNFHYHFFGDFLEIQYVSPTVPLLGPFSGLIRPFLGPYKAPYRALSGPFFGPCNGLIRPKGLVRRIIKSFLGLIRP